MKIFHVITGLKIGGAESALYNFLSYATKHKDSQHCVAYFHHGPNVKKIEDLGVPTHKISGVIHHYDPFAYRRLKKLIKKFNPDVLHTALWSSNIIGRLIGRSMNIPVVSDQHGLSKHEGSFRNFMDIRTSSISKKIIAVSDAVHDDYQKTIVGAIKNRRKADTLSSKVVVIKNGIDVDGVRDRVAQNPLIRTDIGLNLNDFVVGGVGRLEAIKSYDVLIQAFKKFLDSTKSERTPKLLLIGDGSQREKLKKMVTDLDLKKHVLFAGFRNDAYRFYPLFDCLAFSSQSEGLSISLLEGLSFGVPVVTTHSGAKHDVLTDGENGFLVPVNDVDVYAQKLKKLYDDQQLASKIKAANKQLAASFSIDQTVDKYFDVYQEVAIKLKESSKKV